MIETTRCKGGREQVREYLIEAREKAGLTQQDVANRIGISRQYYQMVETGERQKRMGLSLAGGLSVVLNIPIAEIVQRESAAQESENRRAEHMTLKPEHIVEALNKKTFDEIDPDEVLKHYGYKPEEVRCNGVGIGVWRKEEAFQKLGDIGAFMRFVDHKAKARIEFNYDPDFPAALLITHAATKT